jgi:hypothetical protein
MGHRLAPIGEREVGIDLLRLLERLDCILVLEVVKQLHAPQKGHLRGFIAAVREGQLTEITGSRHRMLMTVRTVGIDLPG